MPVGIGEQAPGRGLEIARVVIGLEGVLKLGDGIGHSRFRIDIHEGHQPGNFRRKAKQGRIDHQQRGGGGHEVRIGIVAQQRAVGIDNLVLAVIAADQPVDAVCAAFEPQFLAEGGDFAVDILDQDLERHT